MKFGPVAIAEAKGAVLAHATATADGRLKKGRMLSADDIAALQCAGITTITVAQLEPGDIGEDEAAQRMSSAIMAPSCADRELQSDTALRAEAAFTGRVNLYATCAGTFCAFDDVVSQLNRVDPAVTLATLADGSYVEEGRMVATIKIIPFAVREATLLQIEAIAATATTCQVHAAQPRSVALIATELPSLKPSVMDKTARLLGERLQRLGSSLKREMRVPHTQQAVADALQVVAGPVDIVIVFGASAITDARDVIPAAIEVAGGTVHRFGMPVDPGNLLLIGDLNGTPVIGAPGCARSPAENGFDWVLQRVVCGLPVGNDYLTGLGVGGLLMEITSRPQPREG